MHCFGAFLIKLYALVIRITGVHDLSVLAIRRTTQITSRPTEILYILVSEMAICGGDEFDSYTRIRIKLRTIVTVRVKGLGLGLGLRLGLYGPLGYRPA